MQFRLKRIYFDNLRKNKVNFQMKIEKNKNFTIIKQ